MRSPSTKRLEAFFPGHGKELRKILAGCDGSHKGIDAALDAVDKIIDGCGVEAIRVENSWVPYYLDIGCLYVNVGETYQATILYDVDRDSFQATDYGTWVELAERRNVRCV